MYLCDRDLRALLPAIRFETQNPDYPFLADDQIQPCSIDLRLDNVFWRQRSRGVIDLRRSKLLELSPRHHWKKTVLKAGESITIKPGELLLGRTYEAFTIPSEYAGKLEGRSSFARMGLAVHCSADFINPGYRGRMPLELVNFGRMAIRVFPLVPICQVMLVRLSAQPERVYGERELSSKYMDDDGGPSYWWRDKRICQLQEALREYDVSERIQAEVLDVIGPCEPELIERFERLVRSLPKVQMANADELLDCFAKAEDRSHLRERIFGAVKIGTAPMLITLVQISLLSVFSQPFGWPHYALWGATLASIPLSIVTLVQISLLSDVSRGGGTFVRLGLGSGL